MRFDPHQLYHLYNRGNNKERIFFRPANYHYFLRKIRKHLSPYCDILAYCLMPNHFHLLIAPKELQDSVHSSGQTASSRPTAQGPTGKHDTQMQPLTRQIAVLLSSYTQAINKQENRTGSLFQQKTKAVPLITEKDKRSSVDHAFICFHYIHQNPLRAHLVEKMEEWEFSSFRDYIGDREETLCHQSLARSLLDLPDDPTVFYQMSYEIVDDEVAQKHLL